MKQILKDNVAFMNTLWLLKMYIYIYIYICAFTNISLQKYMANNKLTAQKIRFSLRRRSFSFNYFRFWQINSGKSFKNLSVLSTESSVLHIWPTSLRSYLCNFITIRLCNRLCPLWTGDKILFIPLLRNIYVKNIV